MGYKFCPNCRQVSYSAENKRHWFCPNCGKNLDFILTEDSCPHYFYNDSKPNLYLVKK